MTYMALAGTGRFILTCGLICGGAWMLQKRISPEAGAADTFLESGLIATAWTVLSTTVCGAFGLITNGNMVLCDFAFFIVALYLYIGRSRETMKTNFTRSERGAPLPFKLLVSAVAVLAVAGWIWAWVSPPPPWDAFVYHLGFPAAWIGKGKIFPMTVPFGDQAGTYFPSNAELIYLRILLSLGQDFAANALEYVFLVYAVVSVYRMSQFTGAAKAESAMAAAGAFFVPIIFHQAVSAEVDIIFAALFMSAFYFLYKWSHRPASGTHLMYSFLALGLFAGTKTIALVLILIVAVPVYIYFLIHTKEWTAYIKGCVVAMLCGGFWYGRNFVITGNPVFPLTVKAFGKEIFHGAYTRATMLKSLFHTNSIAEWTGELVNSWGLPVLLLCGAATLFVLLHPRSGFRARIAAALPWAVLPICFFIIPYNREVRFTFSAFFLSCVSVASATELLRKRFGNTPFYIVPAVFFLNLLSIMQDSDGAFYVGLSRSIIYLITVPHPVYSMMSTGALLLLIGGVGSSAIFYYFFVNGKSIRGIWIFMSLFCILSFTAGICIISARYPNYQYSYYSYFPMGKSWSVLHRIRPEPVRVAYTGTDLNYGLTGPFLKNTVYYVPITKWEAGSFHECTEILKERRMYRVPDTDRIDFCRREPDYNAWVERLFDENTDILYVAMLHQNDLPHLAHDAEGFPIERTWADSHKDRFRLIYANRQARIYDIIIEKTKE